MKIEMHDKIENYIMYIQIYNKQIIKHITCNKNFDFCNISATIDIE